MIDSPDPYKPVKLAARSCRALALLLLIVAAIATLPLLSGHRFYRVPNTYWVALGAIFCSGIAYVVLSIFIIRRQAWAVTVAIVMASLQAAGAAASLVLAVVNLSNKTDAWAVLPILIVLLAVVVLGQFVYQLARSYGVLCASPDAGPRGFAPLPVQPVPVQPVPVQPVPGALDQNPPQAIDLPGR